MAAMEARWPQVEETNMKNQALRSDVVTELLGFRRVVSHHAGVVADDATPPGTVGFVPSQQYRNAAEQLDGVPGLSAAQVVRLLNPGQRNDADVRRDVLRALMLDSLVPMTVDAQVQDGIVTLSGTVNWYREREDAHFLVACVPGVLGISDQTTLMPAPGEDDGDIENEIVAALARNPILDAGGLAVENP